MAKYAGHASMPVDQPSMVEPKRVVHRESEFFGAPAATGFALEGFAGDTDVGRQKGNRNSNAFPAQAAKTAPYTRLRRR
jgi:hypothetical protein